MHAQDYIASVEQIAAEQRRELERVKEEKRDMEKVRPAFPSRRPAMGTCMHGHGRVPGVSLACHAA